VFVMMIVVARVTVRMFMGAGADIPVPIDEVEGSK
tara:strand:- start:1333 stop:1437 length:105 start_codon:yes stop_codon:yes gene_type:complete